MVVRRLVLAVLHRLPPLDNSVEQLMELVPPDLLREGGARVIGLDASKVAPVPEQEWWFVGLGDCLPHPVGQGRKIFHFRIEGRGVRQSFLGPRWDVRHNNPKDMPHCDGQWLTRGEGL